MVLELGQELGLVKTYKVVQITEDYEFEGAQGTLIVYETRGRSSGVSGERARQLTVQHTAAAWDGTRVAFVDKVLDTGRLASKTFQIGIFVPNPIEEGPDIGTRLESIATSTGILE